MNVSIIGAAKSGMAAARLAARKNYKVFLSESKNAEQFPDEVKLLNELGVEYEFGGNSPKCLTNCDLIVTSPGVPADIEVFKQAEKQGIPIVSELEFGRSFIPDNKLIAITGTNGKTTTTTLTDYIINRSGGRSHLAGNIGIPISNLVDNIAPDDIIVAELSSFQLDRIMNFRPDVAMILNLTPDHLYYHKTFDNYRKAKFNICKNQTENDILILNADDQEVASKYANTRGKIYHFSLNEVEAGIYSKDGKMCVKLPNMQKEEDIMLMKEIGLPGVHNAYNAMAAALASRVFEIKNENIRDCLMAFEGVEHRLERVRSLDGILYVNDSKATNVNATWYALQSYTKPIVWIAGGRGDNNDYSALDEVVQKNVKSIIAIGEEADAIFNHFSSMKRCQRADNMEGAVSTAKAEATSGDVVLFTPACKSFDWFLNYEHRGEVFKDIVNKL